MQRKQTTLSILLMLAAGLLGLTGLLGCSSGGAEGEAPVLLQAEDIQAWEKVCDTLVVRRSAGFNVECPTWAGLADQLSGTKEMVAGTCRAHGTNVERFLAVCRAIGVACSVIEAEQVDAAAPALALESEMRAEQCCEHDHHDAGEEDSHPDASPPAEVVVPISARPEMDPTVAQNVKTVRPLLPEIEQISKRLFSSPTSGE